MYSENYETLIKKPKGINKYRGTSSSWIGKLDIIKMRLFTKLISRFNTIPIKISADLEYWQVNSKIYTERQRTRIAKTTLQ